MRLRSGRCCNPDTSCVPAGTLAGMRPVQEWRGWFASMHSSMHRWAEQRRCTQLFTKSYSHAPQQQQQQQTAVPPVACLGGAQAALKNQPSIKTEKRAEERTCRQEVEPEHRGEVPLKRAQAGAVCQAPQPDRLVACDGIGLDWGASLQREQAHRSSAPARLHSRIVLSPERQEAATRVRHEDGCRRDRQATAAAEPPLGGIRGDCGTHPMQWPRPGQLGRRPPPRCRACGP